ncbi:MAG TPA: AAA family ATPase [Candidatus Acidoferrales bacterium]|nr:AAA family ATPase [Candidatus Acidoferrales bacterium]
MPTAPDKRDELRLLVNSRHPIIAVETSEEARIEALLEDVAAELDVPFFTWSITHGLKRKGTDQAMYETEDPDKMLGNIAAMRGDGIYLLKDFARYLEQDRLLRRVRELAASFRDMRRSIVLSAPVLKLPPELDDDVVPFRVELPDALLLLKVVQATIAEFGSQARIKVELDQAGLKQVAQNLAGLTMEEARRTLAKCILERNKVDARTPSDVLEAKRSALRQEGTMTYLKADTNFADVADLRALKEWLRKRRGALTAEGQKFGLEPPKGVLITGVQGCGKSLCAKAVAGEWSLQLARFDAGALYDKFIGESEKRLRKSLDTAEKLAPIVLWIDEIEKGFAATGSSADVDAGLTQRILATLLTWLQDRGPGVFLVATSNNIHALPPELLRKGRFDEIFFVDLPDAEARAELFRIHLKRRGRDPAGFDLAAPASACEGFSGAEVEQAIASALYTAFSKQAQLSTEIVAAECHATRPLSVTRREEVERLRDWARERAVPAN